MLGYILDTNICIYLMKAQPPSVIARFSEHRKNEIAISSVTWAELCCGLNIYNSKPQMSALLEKLEVVPFDMDAAVIFGKLSQEFPERKNSLDRMIAAHALALNVALVTNNRADFDMYARVGLRIENWV
jgi:tRNA(fMet)-specific endonuclease VapC